MGYVQGRQVVSVKILWLILAAALAGSLTASGIAQSQEPTLVIRNGLLIDGTGRPPVENATVIVTRDRIMRVTTEQVAIPPGARVVDATGLTILPGLIDAHIHSRPWAWRLFLQFGVTTVRDVGSDPDVILRDRERERRGELVAPRIFACGPLLDGDPPVWGTTWRGSLALRTADEARAAVQLLLDRGVDCIKVYARLPSALMRAVVEVARARGIPVTGHLGAVLAREAVEMGVQSIEHASGMNFPMPVDQLELLMRLLTERGTFIVPTMLVDENFANLPSIGNAQYPFLSLVPDAVARQWLDWRNDFRLRGATDETFARQRMRSRAKAEFVRMFHRGGGKVVAGSDTPNPFVVPGISLHQELEQLVAAGVPAMDAIVSATSTAAALLRRPDLGVVEVGRLADLVLVSGNPVSDIRATRNVRMVVKGGSIVYEER